MSFQNNSYFLSGWLRRISEPANAHFPGSLTNYRGPMTKVAFADDEVVTKVQELSGKAGE